MDRFVKLFDEKKLKRVELYRSETLGECREEIWCDINLTDIAIHRVDVYRKGYVIESHNSRTEAIYECLSGDGEMAYDVKHFADARKLVGRMAINRKDVLTLLNGISLLFFAKSSCRTDEDIKHCFSSSPLYPQRGNHDHNFNSITIEYIDKSVVSIDFPIDSIIRWSISRDLDSIPVIKKYFIGAQTIRKITMENLTPDELSEIRLLLCILDDPIEVQYIEAHLYRDENGDVLYPNDERTTFEKLFAY